MSERIKDLINNLDEEAWFSGYETGGDAPHDQASFKALMEAGVKRRAAQKALEETVLPLLETSKTLLATCERYLEEIGDCDHSVNICCCDLKREIVEAQAVISKAEGKPMVGANEYEEAT